MRKVAEEMREKERLDDLHRQQRYFDTTNRTDYIKKDP